VNAPGGDAALIAWEVIRRLGGQVRAGPNGVTGLDLSAALALAAAMGADNPLLIDLLPEIEPILVKAWNKSLSE
jgi:hypothetical protein